VRGCCVAASPWSTARTAWGHLDAGLFFLAYQRDPRRAFGPVQRELARHDAMNECVRHVGSSVWARPPGVDATGWWGETVLG
jgi:deferrochelatase/peroxidase EfeB